MAKKRKTKVDTTLTLGDVDLDLQKVYGFIGEQKYAHARQALTRARSRLNAIRGVKGSAPETTQMLASAKL